MWTHIGSSNPTFWHMSGLSTLTIPFHYCDGIIVMTVLMQNARELLPVAAQRAFAERRLYDILYADDTLILGTDTGYVEELAKAIEQAGAEFGMTLHWGKTQALADCAESTLKDPSGNLIEDSGSLVYLGGLLTADAK